MGQSYQSFFGTFMSPKKSPGSAFDIIFFDITIKPLAINFPICNLDRCPKRAGTIKMEHYNVRII
jgi:hypothetical protein